MHSKDIVAVIFRGVQDWLSPILETVADRLNALDAKVKAIPAGEKGDRGEPGESIKGADGINAYQLAVQRGYGGTELQWLDSLKGEPGQSIKGDPGERGIDGIGKDGADGINGKDGTHGEPGTAGEMGPIGPQGAAGEKGADGESIVGEPGPAGKDADPALIKSAVESGFQVLAAEFVQGLAE